MDYPDSETLRIIAAEFDALHRDVRSDLGVSDEAYIRRLLAIQRGLDAGGRGMLLTSRWLPALLAGTGMLAVAKILENIEIGHGVAHGQWDWMGDPAIHSSRWEFDAVWTSASWKRAHNYRHHTFTNVVGLDRDIGYSCLRVDPRQPWQPIYLLQPIYALLIGVFFEWAIALYDLEIDRLRTGQASTADLLPEIIAMANKVSRQIAKDYVRLPLAAGRSARRAVAGAFAANVVRNVWAQTIVYCGHIPGGPETFTVDQYAAEDAGGRYFRQLAGSCDIDGGRLFDVMSGHLGYQIEHHLFPGLPSKRYPYIAKRVRAICEENQLPYNTGPLRKQYGAVVGRIIRLALPGPRIASRPRART